MTMKDFDLIIFDCDGTLVDTELLHQNVLVAILSGLGLLQFTVEYNLEHFAGKGMDATIGIIERESGRALPPTFLADYVRGVEASVATELKLVDGVLETLARLRESIPVCVASNGERSNVTAMISAGGLNAFFPNDHIFTKDQVVRPKPAPDLFLFAAARVGADPARTLVVEDSLTGAQAGLAAGMVVAGTTAVHHEPAAQEAALRALGVPHILRRFSDIEALLPNALPAKRA